MRRGAKPTESKAAAKPPVARKSLKNEGSRVRDLEKRLAEALEQRAALSEILGVIRQSPTDVQPVFDTIVRSAVHLCDGMFACVFRFDGELMHLAAHHNYTPEAHQALQEMLPMRPRLDSPLTAARAILMQAVVQVEDALAPTTPSPAQHIARAGGFRSVLAVPMLREGDPIGAIFVAREQPGPFSPARIELLQTFADQAVIAIENVRLFKELEARNRALTEALEQQTATAEVLSIISTSPTDLQPVLDAVVRSVARFCGADNATVFQVDGDTLHVVAHHGSIPVDVGLRFPCTRGTTSGRTVLERRAIHVTDLQAEAAEFPEGSAFARRFGHRTTLSVPLLREGTAIGVIQLRRPEADPFTDKQVALLQTFADQAEIAIENVRLFTELEARNRDLTAALEQQTATGEILRVISSSPTDEKPVFDAIARSSVRLCRAAFSVVAILDADEMLHLVASEHVGTEGRRSLAAAYPMRPNRGQLAGRAILDRAVVHVADVTLDPEYVGAALGNRATLSVPMLRKGTPIGTITIGRFEPVPFTDQQIELLKTFADQAVIAIENVRLFTELQSRNRDLTEALEQQTATAEILRVISSSPTSAQPVFDTILVNALHLCEAHNGGIFTFDGQAFRIAAAAQLSDEFLAYLREAVILPGRETPLRRVGLEPQTSHVADILADPSFSPPEVYGREGMRTSLAVPMLKEGRLVGAFAFHRRNVRPFTEKQITLLETFADQAVIAIENVRLFKELESRNRELTEALDQQTATSEILRVIGSAHTDAQPVFDTIVRSAVRLCNAANAAVFRTDGKMLYHPANFGSSPEALAAARARYPRPLDMDSTPGIAVLTRSVVQVPDIEHPSALEFVRQVGRLLGFRSVVTVPMLGQGDAVGAIVVTRREPGPFSDAEVELLKTFADQAVIAVENVRLFNELQARTQDLTRSVEQLRALSEVSRAVSSTLDLETVLRTIVSRAVQLSGLDGGVVFEYNEGAGEFIQRAATETGGALAEVRRATRIPKGEGVLGRTAITLEPVQVSDITVPGAYESRLRDNLIESGIRAIVAVPMVREGSLIGCLGVTRNRPGEFPAETIELLRTFAAQSALAIQNARLYRELEQKSRELEAASQHKSEFLANMSHELRTPLNAIIGFSEVLAEGMFGEINDKQTEYLKDILESGRHLLSLINDILDLSKIEAGRMELEPTDFDLPAAIDNALTLVRERANRRGIALGWTVDERLGTIRGDERKVKQVLLNLISNALKFTPEGGRIDVRAAMNEGLVEVSVADTGVGIAPEDQEAVFEEFRQVGTADKKVEGTGLGLALSRKFIELHGGRIWVKSQLGQGSTFTFTLPVRREPSDRGGAPTLIS